MNATVIDGTDHDVAVSALKCAGDEVALEVKYFRPAELFFSRSKWRLGGCILVYVWRSGYNIQLFRKLVQYIFRIVQYIICYLVTWS